MHNVVETHIGYAHAIAAETLKKCPPNVDRRELRSAAELGLVRAARAYDPSAGIAFSTFAYYHIRGAIYDELRQMYRASYNKVSAAEYIPGPSPDKPFARMVPSDEASRAKLQSARTCLLSMQALPQEPASTNAESPADRVLRKEQVERVKAALMELPEKYRQLFHAYYYGDLSFEEIGQQLRLSKSWISRMHAKGLDMLREILGLRNLRLEKRKSLAVQNAATSQRAA
jgi:RNA polymerase sigma factor FliA